MRLEHQMKHGRTLMAILAAGMMLVTSSAFGAAPRNHATPAQQQVHAVPAPQINSDSRTTGGFMEWILQNHDFLRFLQTGGFMEWLVVWTGMDRS